MSDECVVAGCGVVSRYQAREVVVVADRVYR